MPLNLSPNATLGRSTLHNAARLGPSNLSFPASFDPRSLPNLAAWFDARYPAGFGGAIPSDGTALSQWNDLSGNGRHATQATGSQQPLFRKANPNLLTYNQATVETDTTGLAALNANSTIARSTTDAAHGTASLQVTSVAAGLTGANTLTGASGVPVSPSTQYTAVVSAKAPTITSNWTPIIYWWKANGTASATPSSSGTAGALSASYAQRSVTATSPSDAAFATVGFSWTAVAASEVVRVDQLGLWLGSSTAWLPPVTLPNGLGTVQFDGANDQLYWAAGLPASARTMYVACTVESSGAASYAIALESDLIVEGLIVSTTASTAIWRDSAGTTISTSASASPIATPRVDSGTLSGSGISAAHNGVATATTPPGSIIAPPESAPLYVGSRANGTFPGSIAALLVYSAAHTTTHRQAVERWLGRTFGVSVA